MNASQPTRRILVCQGLFCSAQGSRQVLSAFQAALSERADIVAEAYYCFNGCGHGPNVVLHPGHIWYEAVSPSTIPEIVTQAETGQPSERGYGSRVPPTVKENAFLLVDRKYNSEEPLSPTQ